MKGGMIKKIQTESLINIIENMNEVDETIYKMMSYHFVSGQNFFCQDNPKLLQIGWISCDGNCFAGIRLTALKNRKSSQILYTLGINNSNLVSHSGRKEIANKLTNPNSEEYINLKEFSQILKMQEALE